MCINALEHPQTLSDQNHFDNLMYSINESLQQKPSEMKQISLKLKFLLIEQEEDLNNLIKFMIQGVNSDNYQLKNLITETIKLIVQSLSTKKNIVGDSLAFKNTKEILSQMSQQQPRFFNSNLSFFRCLYDSDSYLLRNALNEILGNIIRLILTKSQINQENDNHEQNEQNKKKLLKILIGRQYDKNSYCRSNLLQVYQQLAEENAIPFENIFEVLQVCCGRIKDVSANVRKKSMNCIQIFIKLYYSLYVESQGQQKFLNLEQLDNQKEFVLQDQLICKQRIKENEEQIKSLNAEQEGIEQQFDSLQAERNQLKRTLEDNYVILNKLQDYKSFLELMGNLFPVVVQLLGSKSIYDVTEAIKLILIYNKYNIQNSQIGIQKMLLLIWSKEKSIKDEVISAYYNLFLNQQEQTSIKIAKNLINIVNESDINQITSLEELLSCMLVMEDDKKQKVMKFSLDVFKDLWDLFLKSFQIQDEQKQKKSALILIRIISSKNQDWVIGKLELLIGIVSNMLQNKKPDFFIIKEICRISENFDGMFNNSRFKILLQNIICTLIKYQGYEDANWYCAMEQAINTIYNVNYSFENTAQFIIMEMSKFMFQQDHAFENKLSQLIFTIGQVAVKFLIMMDDLENQFKKLQNEQEQKSKNNQNQEEQELNKVDGLIDVEFDKRQTLIQNISEQCIVHKNLISQYLKIILGICKFVQTQQQQQYSLIARSAMLTLTKLMVISPDFCKQHIEMVLEFVKQDNIDPIIKNNIFIALGDLLHRHPNIIEPYISCIYLGLRDKNLIVRKTCLMVITHLILNDMLKATGDISELSKLFNDDDSSIQELVQLFFYELNKKDNKVIHNLLTDFIGKLSKQDFNGITEEQFQKFSKMIIQYLEKDKYQESMIEKLCQRLKVSENNKELHNTSYILTLLTYSDKGIKKLSESFDCYRDKLSDNQVYDNFQQIIKKLKKNQKQETKNLIDELENKLNYFESEGINENQRKNQKKPRQRKQKKIFREENSEQSDEQSDKISQKSDKQQQSAQKRQLRQRKRNVNMMEEEDE